LPVCAAPYLVYPDDPFWNAELRNSKGTASISSENPRGYDDGVTSFDGNASLKLTTSGIDTDWAFYARYAGESATSSWGLLSELTALSFDWYRDKEDTVVPSNLSINDPWLVQTPVLRLLIRDTINETIEEETTTRTYFSELVWERWYTDYDVNTMIIDTWVSQNLINQNFWHHTITVEGYTLENGESVDPYLHDRLLMASPTGEWALNKNIDYPYSESAVIYGLSVGVGSTWLYPYTGFVDNVYLAFNGNDPVLNDNFELRPIPEPATLILLGSGIAAMGIGRKRRPKSSRS
jgi:hypothetical protein